MDASPHLMAPTQEEEFKGDKRLASPQTRNSGYLSFFQFVHNTRQCGKALLGALVEAIVG
jgi:hypothetical protein